MKYGTILGLFLLASVAAHANDTAEKPAASEASKGAKHVVIITGIDYPGHKWRQTTPVLKRQIEKDKRLVVDVVEDPKFLASEKLATYDVVVLHFMDWEKPDPGPKARANLKRLVQEGKGLVVVHFACGAFQEWPEFRNLAGRAWNPKLRGHDPHGAFRVEIVDGKHPITNGMKSFDTTDELYTCLEGDREIRLLAKSRSKVDGKDYPMAFVFDYGKGRVFHSPLGHDVKALECDSAGALFRRACAWAARIPPQDASPSPRKKKEAK